MYKFKFYIKVSHVVGTRLTFYLTKREQGDKFSIITLSSNARLILQKLIICNIGHISNICLIAVLVAIQGYRFEHESQVLITISPVIKA